MDGGVVVSVGETIAEFDIAALIPSINDNVDEPPKY